MVILYMRGFIVLISQHHHTDHIYVTIKLHFTFYFDMINLYLAFYYTGLTNEMLVLVPLC